MRVRRRTDDQGVECHVRGTLGLDRHAEGVGDQAAADREDMRLVPGLRQCLVGCLENGQRSKAQVGKAGWQQQADALHWGPPYGWAFRASVADRKSRSQGHSARCSMLRALSLALKKDHPTW